jgi:hypothetical protein
MKYAHLLLLFMLCSFSGLILLPSPESSFLADDYRLILHCGFQNPLEIWTLFTQNWGGTSHDGGYYRPIPAVTYAIDYWLWDWNPWGFRFTNLFIHLLNIALFDLFVRRLIGDGRVSIIAAAIFALHPIHTPAIFWIAARSDLLACFFLLAGCIFEFSKQSRIIPATICFFLALLSKEMAITFPLLLFTLDFFSYSFGQWKIRPWRHLLRYSLYAGIIGVYFVIRYLVLGCLGDGSPHLDFWKHAQGMAFIFGNLRTYWIWLFIPLSSFFEHASGYFYLYRGYSFIWLVLFVTILSGWFAFYATQKNLKLGFMALIFTLVAILPVLFIPMHWYLYIPSIGFCLGVAVWFREMTRILARKIYFFAPMCFYGILLGILGIYGVLDIREERLYQKAGIEDQQIKATIHATLPDFPPNSLILAMNIPSHLMSDHTLGGPPLYLQEVTPSPH